MGRKVMEDNTQWDCEHCGYEGICYKHSLCSGMGHITFGCDGKCKDYQNRNEVKLGRRIYVKKEIDFCCELCDLRDKKGECRMPEGKSCEPGTYYKEKEK